MAWPTTADIAGGVDALALTDAGCRAPAEAFTRRQRLLAGDRRPGGRRHAVGGTQRQPSRAPGRAGTSSAWRRRSAPDADAGPLHSGTTCRCSLRRRRWRGRPACAAQAPACRATSRLDLRGSVAPTRRNARRRQPQPARRGAEPAPERQRRSATPGASSCARRGGRHPAHPAAGGSRHARGARRRNARTEIDAQAATRAASTSATPPSSARDGNRPPAITPVVRRRRRGLRRHRVVHILHPRAPLSLARTQRVRHARRRRRLRPRRRGAPERRDLALVW